MRSMIAALALTGLLAGSAQADTMKNCAASWKAMAPADKAKTTYKTYSATCMKGTTTSPAGAASSAMSAPAPMAAKPAAAPMAMSAKPASTTSMAASGPAPAGATGQCKDGSYTMAKTHSGACSHHGGVTKWL